MTIRPHPTNAHAMWDLMNALFPIYRTLAGPGFHESLKIIQNQIPLTINEFASGKSVFDWIIPREFKVNESYVVRPDGEKILNFEDCHYHVWAYSQPFYGTMDREALIKNIATHHSLPDAVPLRVTYYRDKWGLCASRNQVQSLPEGDYYVHIDTEHYDGFLRIGEFYLPGEKKEEILITSYLCHPRGANDNLSGVVVATELFKLLAQLKQRRYSYRLAIWPERIGALTYIYHYPDRLKHTSGGYSLYCLGDDESGCFNLNYTCFEQSPIDRAALHALKHLEYPYRILPGIGIHSDEREFNGSGLRIPFGNITRSPTGGFSAYHTSRDDLEYVKPEILFQSLNLYWKIVMNLERNAIYKGNFTVEPFLSGHGIYPYDLGVGEGTTMANDRASAEQSQAYHYLMWGADGERDLLDIASLVEHDIEIFDRPVSQLLEKKLIREI